MVLVHTFPYTSTLSCLGVFLCRSCKNYLRPRASDLFFAVDSRQGYRYYFTCPCGLRRIYFSTADWPYAWIDYIHTCTQNLGYRTHLPLSTTKEYRKIVRSNAKKGLL